MSDHTLVLGDCRAAMAAMAPESVDAIVCDPPYELGFMGKKWDKSGVAFDPATWAECLRVLKPGGRMLAFGGSRTAHRIWCAIEDGGFVIEDTMMWLYGSGFPKHKSKLKPAYEPICVARKGGVSELNIDAARIGWMNDADKESAAAAAQRASHDQNAGRTVYENFNNGPASIGPYLKSMQAGRWPANVCLDEEAAAMLDEQSGDVGGGVPKLDSGSPSTVNTYGTYARRSLVGHSDSGGASRFYYTAKASRSERDAGLEGHDKRNGGSTAKGFTDDVANGQDRNRPVANHHPTVKPVDLMRWLVRLVTLPGQTVLDPFMGSGTTGIACISEGRNFIGCELNPEYIEMARGRINNVNGPLFAAPGNDAA